MSPSGKASGFGPDIRRFESFHPRFKTEAFLSIYLKTLFVFCYYKFIYNFDIGFQDGLDAFLSAMMPNCWEFKAGL